MAYGQQTIQTPLGINVFGSAMIRVKPDIAVLYFAVSGFDQQPKEAFHKAHEAAKNVREFLARAEVPDVSSSRVILAEEIKYKGDEETFLGYTARVDFHALLYDLERIETVLIGVVDAGAHRIRSIELQTTQLKEFRQEVRRRAVAAAREKAGYYCEAAGVQLGKVIHIEDINPDVLEVGGGERRFHTRAEVSPDDKGELKTFDPGSIAIGAAVMMSFEITHGRQDSKKAGYFKPQDKDTK